MGTYRKGEFPDLDRMVADVNRVRHALPDAHVVAHRDPESGVVSFHLHMRERAAITSLLGDVPVHTMPGGTFRFQGRRTHMDGLLHKLGVQP